MKCSLSFAALVMTAVCVCSGVAAGFESETDYSLAMLAAASAGDREAGLAAEQIRNEKIDAMELDEEKYSYDDMVLLAQVIHTEAGSAWLPDDWRMAVGEVVLNRVASVEFPDTLEECVFQPGQYSAADRDWFAVLIPYESCIEAAQRLLSGERVMNDESVVFQSNTAQGGGVCLQFTDQTLGTTYFCYTTHPELYV